MIRAGINIGNSKISCVVCDFKNINNIKILSLIEYPNKELKKNIILNYKNILQETKKIIGLNLLN